MIDQKHYDFSIPEHFLDTLDRACFLGGFIYLIKESIKRVFPIILVTKLWKVQFWIRFFVDVSMKSL